MIISHVVALESLTAVLVLVCQKRKWRTKEKKGLSNIEISMESSWVIFEQICNDLEARFDASDRLKGLNESNLGQLFISAPRKERFLAASFLEGENLDLLSVPKIWG